MDSFMALTYVAGSANVLLLLGVLYPALSNFRKTRSSIAAMLLVVALSFLVQNIIAIYFHMTIPYALPVEFEVMVLTMLETVSFATLFVVSYK